ncbi:MAG: hypothetical protein QME40_07660 [bacterium]|nr:hypothetical protein [bacterium]
MNIGRWIRIFLLIGILICSQVALCEVNIIISEVSPKGNWAELYCLDDGGQGVDISSYKLTDLDGRDTKLSDSKVTLKKGEFVVIHWVDSEGIEPYIDETDERGDVNGNGYIDLYLTDTNPTNTDDQLVLVDEKGEYLDAVCWANQDGVFSMEAKDVSTLVKASQWIISGTVPLESDCIDSRKVTSSNSMARIDLSRDSNSKSDWAISTNATPGEVNEIDTTPPEKITGVSVTDFSPDQGGRLKVSWEESTAGDFDHYNIYIDTKMIKEINDLDPEISIKDRDTTCVILDTCNGEPLENGVDYWVGVTAVDINGNEDKEVVAAGPASPSDDIPGDFKLFINEVSFKEKDSDWVELYCKDDGMEGKGIDISGYYIGNGKKVIKTILPGTLVKTSEYLVLHGNISLTSTDEQVILYDPFGDIIDCVCWADQSGTFSSGEKEDVQMLIDEGRWKDFPPKGADEEDCIDSREVKPGYSIARCSYTTPASKEIWRIDETPTPGRSNAKEPERPAILNLEISPNPFLVDGSSPTKAETKISFDLSEYYCSVSIKIYDTKGRLIRDLFGPERLFGKEHEVLWDGKDNDSKIVPIGIYIVYLKTTNSLGSTIKTATCVAAKRLR